VPVQGNQHHVDRKLLYTEQEGSEVYWLSSMRKDTAVTCMWMTRKCSHDILGSAER